MIPALLLKHLGLISRKYSSLYYVFNPWKRIKARTLLRYMFNTIKIITPMLFTLLLNFHAIFVTGHQILDLDNIFMEIYAITAEETVFGGITFGILVLWSFYMYDDNNPFTKFYTFLKKQRVRSQGDDELF